MDEIYEAGVKHKSKLVELKQIADEQKVKIGCLRMHRDEIKDELIKLEDVHNIKMNQNDEIVCQMNEEIIKIVCKRSVWLTLLILSRLVR